MTREVLHLPEPARTLLHTTFETLDGALGEIVPEGRRWCLGGGTVLAARWTHRKSTDVDIFLPANSRIAALDPRWNPRFTNAMNALGASRVEVQDRSLKFTENLGESCEGPFPRLTDRRNNPSVRAAGIDVHGFFGSCAPCHAATTHTVEPLIR